MVQKRVQVSLKNGLQARPAALFVQEANRFHADIFIEKDGKTVNAKSIMGIMSLAIGTGSMITITTEGSDAEEEGFRSISCICTIRSYRVCAIAFLLFGACWWGYVGCVYLSRIVGKSISCVETSIY